MCVSPGESQSIPAGRKQLEFILKVFILSLLQLFGLLKYVFGTGQGIDVSRVAHLGRLLFFCLLFQMRIFIFILFSIF